MTELEHRLETFLVDLEREGYEVGAGLKDEADFTAVYTKHPNLFTEGNAAAAHVEIPLIRGRDTVEAFIRVNIIDEAIKEPTDALITRELAETIKVDGETSPFRQAQVLISNETSPLRRRAIDAARLAVQRSLNPLLADLQKTTFRMACDMGYANYLEFFERIELLNLSDLRAHTQRFLAETESVYLELLTGYRERLLPNVRADELLQCDMVYMRRGGAFDSLFAADAMLPAVWKTLRALGIDAENNPRIILDIEHRDKKSPRAFCAPVRVPDEVYLVIMPHGGADDYNSFLHELGHTLHFAHTAAELPFGARFLGDNSVTEAHAMTMEYLCYYGPWLEWALGKTDTADYLKFMDFFEMYMLRRYCAKLHYEMELHGGAQHLDDCARLYARTLTTATRVIYSPDDYLHDVDPHFYCARYLRAWMLRRQIVDTLEQRFGAQWFTNENAGALLRELWALGQSVNAEAVSKRIGYDALNMDALIQHYKQTYA